MRSRECAGTLAVAFALATVAVQAAPPTREEVQRAAAAVRADPQLGGIVKEKTLRFKQGPTQAEPARETVRKEERSSWLLDFLRWFAEVARWVVWLLAAVLVALLLVGLHRWVRLRAGKGTREALAPSHVQSLDIRPQSLPARVGAAAAELWERGEHRAALSLLYRGALSRLVHGHGVPIRAASTEGECIVLARGHVAPAQETFFAQLVRAWQLAVYGARLPEPQQALALCREFDLQLPPPAPSAPAARR